MIEGIGRYLKEMGAPDSLFDEMKRAPSTSIRFLSSKEIDLFGLRGSDPAWEERGEAAMEQEYGHDGWVWLKQCLARVKSGNLQQQILACEARELQLFPHR